jgi:Icc-related predicted phosphoesterase
MSITLIGDVHGKYEKYHRILSRQKENPYTLQVGDLGFKYDTLRNVDHTKHLILPGNHDNYDTCYNYKHFLLDFGYMVNFNGIDFFYYRGAYSIDKQYRTIGVDWWENEEVKIENFMKARELYRSIKPDIMISHDCPQDIAKQMLEPHQRIYENITSWALQELLNIHQPKLWFFGHWHRSVKIQYGNTQFVCLNELETYILTKDSY